MSIPSAWLNAVPHNCSPIFKTFSKAVLNLVGEPSDQKIVLSGLHVHAGLQQLKIWKLGIGVSWNFQLYRWVQAVWYWILFVRGIQFSFSNNGFVQLSLFSILTQFSSTKRLAHTLSISLMPDNKFQTFSGYHTCGSPVYSRSSVLPSKTSGWQPDQQSRWGSKASDGINFSTQAST